MQSDRKRAVRGDGGEPYWAKKLGRFVAALPLSPGADGKRRRKVFYGETAKEAADKRRDYLRTPTAQIAAVNKTSVEAVGKAWIEYLERLGRKRNTVRSYRSLL